MLSGVTGCLRPVDPVWAVVDEPGVANPPLTARGLLISWIGDSRPLVNALRESWPEREDCEDLAIPAVFCPGWRGSSGPEVPAPLIAIGARLGLSASSSVSADAVSSSLDERSGDRGEGAKEPEGGFTSDEAVEAACREEEPTLCSGDGT